MTIEARQKDAKRDFVKGQVIPGKQGYEDRA
jgi:hypothetical protein